VIKNRALAAILWSILSLSFICGQGIASEKDIINDTESLDIALNLHHPEGNSLLPSEYPDEDLPEIDPQTRAPRSSPEGKIGASIIPGTKWQKCLGGSRRDGAFCVQQTSDGGYIVAGAADSNDGDVSGNHGSFDYWLVKLDSAGDMQWQRCLGGSGLDYAQSVQQTSDGGYIVAGYTSSNDGDVSGNHDYEDGWLVKIDNAGTMQWQRCLGGSGNDYAQSVQQTSDGGYIVAGYTNSNDGDVISNHGSLDYWLVKLDSAGTMQWQKCLGGSGWDEANSVQQTSDGGYIVAGYTDSNDGDVSGNHGGYDCWLTKLDRAGTMQWQKCLGGSGRDIARSILETSDGGCIVAGYTNSIDGDVGGNHGNNDCWLVKLDRAGKLQWQKCLGGSGWDEANSVQETSDGGYIVAGYTDSSDGDVSGNHGCYDYWLVRLDRSGELQWQKCLGGSGLDEANSVQETSDGGYIVAGTTFSSDGDVSGKHGGNDYWIVDMRRPA